MPKLAHVSAALIVAGFASTSNAALTAFTNLNMSVASDTPLTITNGADTLFTLTNSFTFVGSYYNGTFYDRSASISSAGVTPSAVTPDTLIGSSTSMSGSSATVARTTTETSYQFLYSYSYFAGYQSYVSGYTPTYRCGFLGLSTCGGNPIYSSYPVYGSQPVYGTVGSSQQTGQIGSSQLYGFRANTTNGTVYGWVDVTVNNPSTSTPYQFVLNGYGFETNGNPIKAGVSVVSAVPELATVPMLLAGLVVVGLGTRRRGLRKNSDV